MKVINKDILTVETGIIVHQVNCMGKMGSGLARQIKEKWPRVYEEYRHRYDYGSWMLGDIQLVSTSATGGGPIVCNLAGQYAFGRDKRHTDYEALERGLASLAYIARGSKIQAYIPYNMGCGLGGGDWTVVSTMIERIIPEAIICRLEK